VVLGHKICAKDIKVDKVKVEIIEKLKTKHKSARGISR